MSESDRERRERLLTALLAGEIRADDERVQEAMRDSSSFKLEWQRLRRLREKLEVEDSERDEILSEILGEDESGADFDPALATSFRRIASGSEGGPSSGGDGEERASGATGGRRTFLEGPVLRAGIVLAAAAALLLAIWIPWGGGGGSETVDGPLGDEGSFTYVEPVGEVSEFGTFRWDPPVGLEIVSYHLEISEETESGDRRRLFLSSKIFSTEFDPELDLPDRIVWKVVGVDASGARVVSDSVARAVRRKQ